MPADLYKINYVLENFGNPAVYNFIRASILDDFKDEFKTFLAQTQSQEEERIISLEAEKVETNNTVRDYRLRLAQETATYIAQDFKEYQTENGVVKKPPPKPADPESYFLSSGSLDLNIAHQIIFFSATLQDTMPSDEAREEYKQALKEFSENKSNNKELFSFLEDNPRTLNFLYQTCGWLRTTSTNSLIAESEFMKTVRGEESSVKTPPKKMPRVLSVEHIQAALNPIVRAE